MALSRKKLTRFGISFFFALPRGSESSSQRTARLAAYPKTFILRAGRTVHSNSLLSAHFNTVFVFLFYARDLPCKFNLFYESIFVCNMSMRMFVHILITAIFLRDNLRMFPP